MLFRSLASAGLGPGDLVAVPDAAAVLEAMASAVEEVASATALRPVPEAAVDLNGVALGVTVAEGLAVGLFEVALAAPPLGPAATRAAIEELLVRAASLAAISGAERMAAGVVREARAVGSAVVLVVRAVDQAVAAVAVADALVVRAVDPAVAAVHLADICVIRHGDRAVAAHAMSSAVPTAICTASATAAPRSLSRAHRYVEPMNLYTFLKSSVSKTSVASIGSPEACGV